MVAQQLRQVGQQQVRRANANIGLQAAEAVDAEVHQRTGNALAHRLIQHGVELLLKVGAVEHAGHQVAAGHNLELFFKLGAGGLGANDYLGAGLAVVTGRREAQANGETLAAAVDGLAAQVVLAALIVVVA